jgi:type VI protein secretion system component VasF
MNEKLFDMLEDRLSRIEAKQDTIINQHGDHKERLVKLESQAGFVKWMAGIVAAFAVATFSWALKHIKD